MSLWLPQLWFNKYLLPSLTGSWTGKGE